MDEHPLARAAAFSCSWPRPLGEIETPAAVALRLHPVGEAASPVQEELRQAIRRMLRHGGYRPSGRGKPASEYLIRAAEDGSLATINPAVDICNAISLHSGFPISVVDLERAKPPFSIRVASPGSAYVFNASGQEIALGGLLCLYDADGPCANAVRDSQRTKTGAATRETLSVVWGTLGFEVVLDEAVMRYRDMLAQLGARTESVRIVPAA